MMSREADALVVGGVVGDVVDPFTRTVSIRVTFSNNREVINGLELKPSHVLHQPRVDVGGHDLRTRYTMVSYIYKSFFCIYTHVLDMMIIYIYIYKITL